MSTRTHEVPVGAVHGGGSPGGPARARRSGPGVVLVVLGAGLAALLVAGTAASFVAVASRQSASGGVEVQDVTEVLVENRCGGDVDVTALGDAGSGQVSATWQDTWSFGRPRHSRSVEAGRLVLRAECPAVTVGVGSTSRLRVEVPGSVPVRVEAWSGDVTAAGLARLDRVATGSGDVTVDAAPGPRAPGGSRTVVRTGSGDVVLRGVGDDLDVETGSGDVRATRLGAAPVRVRTGSGDVDLRADGLVPDVAVRTGSGDVRVTVPDTPAGYAVTATTGSGNTLVGITRDPASPLRMTLSTGSGDVDVVPSPSGRG